MALHRAAAQKHSQHDTSRESSFNSLRRRTVLALGAGALASVAGCTQLTDEESDDESDDDRFPDEEDLFLDVERENYRFDTTEDVLVDGQGDPLGRKYVIEADDIEDIEFRAEPIDGGDPYSFLERINYEETTGVVIESDTDACEELSVQYVTRRDGGGFRVQFCRTKRDPDIECSVGEQHRQVTVLAVPVSFDRQPSGFGMGRSSSCTLPPEHPASSGGEDE